MLEIECGGGTYVRSLGRDLAESLGTAAVMSALVRTAIGRFAIQEAADPRELTAESCLALLHPLARAVDMLPAVVLSAEEVVAHRPRVEDLRGCRAGGRDSLAIAHGGAARGASIRRQSLLCLRHPDSRAIGATAPAAEEIAALDEAGRLVAILGPAGGGLWRPLAICPSKALSGNAEKARAEARRRGGAEEEG